MKNSTKYRHLTRGDREVIGALSRQGISQAEIARRIGIHRSTVSREIGRGSEAEEIEIKTTKKYLPLTETVMRYEAKKAQAGSEERRRESCKRYKTFKEPGYVKFIDELILSDPRRYSPDTANEMARRAGYKGVSTKTLYNWIEGGLLKVKNIDLLLKLTRKPKAKVKVQKRKYGKSIDERPEKANSREEFGHWEGDSVVGKEHSGQILTLVERQKRIGLMFKFNEMRAENAVTVLKGLRLRYGEAFREIFKSITFDNGSEFAYNEEMSRYTEIYYAHAYRSCERGSNENFNGIIRRFIPKGKDITDLSQDDIDRINHWINTMPRKILGYKTPLELFRLETAV